MNKPQKKGREDFKRKIERAGAEASHRFFTCVVFEPVMFFLGKKSVLNVFECIEVTLFSLSYTYFAYCIQPEC